jgi:hypothetical protein
MRIVNLCRSSLAWRYGFMDTANMARAPKYKLLSDDQRYARRTIADAIDVLCEAVDFGSGGQAKMRVGRLRLPSNEVVGLVQLVFKGASKQRGFIVSLPASTHFTGMREKTAQRECFDIVRLDGAKVDSSGNVVLTRGAELHGVELVPALLPRNPSELDWRIVHHIVAIIGQEERCYRSPRKGFRGRQREMVPDVRFLDCQRLSKLDLPPLKVLAIDICGQRLDPEEVVAAEDCRRAPKIRSSDSQP